MGGARGRFQISFKHMRHNQLDRELELMLLMTENRDYTVMQMCEILGISRRNLYYYLEFFRANGFIVEKHGTAYSLDKNSPFFKKLFKLVHFTEDEAMAMRSLLDKVNDNSVQVQHLRQKLNKLYDLHILDDISLQQQSAANITALYDAIKYRRKVILRNYSSPHSNTVANRVVEPFMFLNGNSEIRCYELVSKQNKTFKVARAESVMVLSEDWEHQDCHKPVYTDAFRFNGEERLPIKMRLDRLAHNLLIEEYPQTAAYITAEEDCQHWLLEIEVCSFIGISRFVMGLYENVEVLGSEEFIEFINKKIEKMAVKF